MASDLFLALLAMDAYNRGYNNGVIVPGTQIGNASLGADSAILGTGVDISVSFFAQAYTLSGGGGTVISYRGTDSNLGLEIPVLSGDLANGYGLAIGLPYGAQTNLAIDFYKAIAGSNLTPEQLRAANITLTGHYSYRPFAGRGSGGIRRSDLWQVGDIVRQYAVREFSCQSLQRRPDAFQSTLYSHPRSHGFGAPILAKGLWCRRSICPESLEPERVCHDGRISERYSEYTRYVS
jgi:hypothetical protein